jgi:hypothetical protein
MDQRVRDIILVSKRWAFALRSQSACAPLEVVNPADVPSIHYSPGKEADALDSEECVEDLSADLYPETLEENAEDGRKALAILLTCRYGSCKLIHLARKSTIAAPQNTTRNP